MVSLPVEVSRVSDNILAKKRRKEAISQDRSS
jgi:hypothetical protein